MEAVVIALIEMIIKCGPTAAILIIKGFETDNPTVEEIRALTIKAPGSYFDD